MTRAAWLRGCVAACVFAPRLVVTQPRSDAATQQSVLRGNVVADPGERPLADVEVAVPSLGRGAHTDSAGDFVLAGLPAGRHRVEVRKVGYGPAVFDVTATGRDTLVRDVALTPVAQTLAAVDVRAPTTPANLTAFERRRALGIGQFVPPAVFDKHPDRTLAAVLETGIPGITLKEYARTGAVMVAAGRGPVSLLGKGMTLAEPLDAKSPRACWANVYLDGVKLYSTGSTQTPPNVAAFTGHEVAAVEYYAGGASTPLEFGGTNTACGTLLIWTRR